MEKEKEKEVSDAMAYVQGMCDAMQEMMDKEKDTITALSFRAQKMLDGLPVTVGLGVAVQLMLNGCNMWAKARTDNDADKYQEFCALVSACSMLAQYTAHADDIQNVKGGIQ